MDINQVGFEVDFLPVGEGEKSGDAIVMRWGNLFANPLQQTVVVIDGGYVTNGDDVVSHITEYYKTDVVNLVISTHPHSDHIGGLEMVLRKLKVGCLAMHRPWSTEHTKGIADLFVNGKVTDQSVRKRLREGLDAAYSLEQFARKQNVKIVENSFAGTYLEQNSGKFEIIGPSKKYYESLIPQFRTTPIPVNLSRTRTYTTEEQIEVKRETLADETLDDTGETSAENDTSMITLLTVAGRSLLFTGDAGMPALRGAVQKLQANGFEFSSLSLIQVPHHGSVHNIGPKLLDEILGKKLMSEQKIRSAFVSAASNNDKKHPSKRVTNAFRRRGTFVYGTFGKKLMHFFNAPDRAGWVDVPDIPFHSNVEIIK